MKSVFIIVDRFAEGIEAIQGVADAYEVAEKMAQETLTDCLAMDSEDSGIYWNNWTEERKQAFYEEEIKSNWTIVERKILEKEFTSI